MFSIGGFELLLIAIIALLVLKPADVPAMAQKLGKLVKKFKNAIDTIKKDING